VEPVEITSPDALQERIAAGGVITLTKGTFATPIAHRTECAYLNQIRLSGYSRVWWTPELSTAMHTFGARKCEHCLRPHRYRPPFLPGT